MSKMNFRDVAETLEQLKLRIESGTVVHTEVFPQIEMPNLSLSPTNGLSFTPAQYAVNLSYDHDIFSELPMKVFSDSYNQQMASIMRLFRSEFYDRIEKTTKKIIPKLMYFHDLEDDTENIRLASDWSDGNALLYFSFEKNPEESNFGMIWNDNKKKNYETRSGNLYLNKTMDIIHETIDFVFRVY